MSTLTDARAGWGWGYRLGGFRNRHSGFTVVRKINWDDKDSEPEWWVQDTNGKVTATHPTLDGAMDIAEATYELQLQDV